MMRCGLYLNQSIDALRILVAVLIACILSVPVAAEPADEPAVDEPPIYAGDREHWSLQPISRPALPRVNSDMLAKTPVDCFIIARLERSQLSLSPPASRLQILRRLKFDLLGLPPSLEEITTFLQDRRPGAYERLVDRFLASPQYGECWAQHWLDLARFAETDGFELDKLRSGAWQYRDWVIQALNSDMTYDRFLRYQIAGDLTADPVSRAEHRIATQFCMAGPDMPDINEQDLRRHDKLNEMTSTVGSVILGFQFHCAQCHDHKYDPISQADFYRLRAVFESAVPLMERDKHVLYLQQQAEPQVGRFYRRGELKGAGAELIPGLPRLAVADGEDFLCQSDQPRIEFCDWLVDAANPLTARVIVNRIWQHHFGRGLTENPSDFGVIAGGPSHPQLLDWLASELVHSGWSIKHLHRLILNSSTYRQAGFGVVDEPGRRDKLAQLDPQNELYAFFPARRLEGELIRDSMLAVSGRLDQTMHGESVFPPLPPELVSTLLKGQWKTSSHAADWNRRSIYVFARRNLRYPIFDVFDRPDAGASCAMRDKSTTAIQSLHLLNSDFTLDCARAEADLLLSESRAGNAPAASPAPTLESSSLPVAIDSNHLHLIQALFMRSLGRPPTSQEAAWLAEQLHKEGELRANLVTACVAIFNSSEFLYLD